jgi:uncharacterized protein YuzE
LTNDSEEIIDWDEVISQNADLGERLNQEGLLITYDEDGDSLLVSIGSGGDAITEQVVDDIFIRLDPDNLKIKGMTILAFKSDFLAQNKIMRKVYSSSFEDLRKEGGTVKLTGRQAQRAQPLIQAVLPRG